MNLKIQQKNKDVSAMRKADKIYIGILIIVVAFILVDTFVLSAGSPADISCDASCHTYDGPLRGVMMGTDEYEKYDAHAAAGITCPFCHITANHLTEGAVHEIPSTIPDSPLNSVDNTVLSCDSEGCHLITHDMIADGHLSAGLTCEACHVSMLPGGVAIESVNWANGVRKETIKSSNFRPVLAWAKEPVAGELPHVDSKDDEGARLMPFNVITGTWWDAGINADVRSNPDTSVALGNPISLSHVKAADSNGDGTVTQEEMRTFDGNGDGQPDYQNAVLRQQDLYYKVSHNIASSTVGIAKALDCDDCHAASGTSLLNSIHFSGKQIKCENCHVINPPIDWRSLGYEYDPAAPESYTDYSEKTIVATPYEARPKPTEVEREPQLF
jgi:methanogenesis multiheme c-type cytochrome